MTPYDLADALGAVLVRLGEHTSHGDGCPTNDQVTHDADDQAIADLSCTCGLADVYDVLKIGSACFRTAHPRYQRVREAKRQRSWNRFGLYWQRDGRNREFTYLCVFCDADLDTIGFYGGGSLKPENLRRMESHAVLCACRWLIERYATERAGMPEPDTLERGVAGYAATRVKPDPGQAVSGEPTITRRDARGRFRAVRQT
jgi:hypothetical protein